MKLTRFFTDQTKTFPRNQSLPPASEGCGKVIFSGRVSVPPGRVPRPGPRWGGGYPSQVQVRINPPPQKKKKLRLSWMGVHPPSGLDGSTSPPPSLETEQHSEYLLCGGRYASCVHAGGLYCLGQEFQDRRQTWSYLTA